MKQVVQGGAIVVLIITSGWLWNSNSNLKSESLEQKAKLVAQIKELKNQNQDLEERVKLLSENTQEKGQEVAKHFVETLLTYDSKDKEQEGLKKLKKMVKSEAEQKLFQTDEDAHKRIDDSAIHYTTKANVKETYYTRSAENKADVTVEYEYVMNIEGEEKKENHSMKLKLVLEDDGWFVEDYDFAIKNGTEGP
ncbi:hypothetical protein [Bacillus cereus group sp. BfR-BA-01347]|uniref:hypothetical protein n=1 Tax=Bacillus cereus group sp. BfR-BA-01347 TaxID=2920310 RepID=UPI001F56D47F|nr:hypothetical protein [Bacillus cereus group sp. BfR-BA-01347]